MKNYIVILLSFLGCCTPQNSNDVDKKINDKNNYKKGAYVKVLIEDCTAATLKGKVI